MTPTTCPRNLQLCPLIPEHPLFAALPWAARVREAVARLLLEEQGGQGEQGEQGERGEQGEEGDTVLCYLSQTFWKPARQGLGTSWHQDNAYFGLRDGRAGVAMWTAVHDAHLANGTLHLLPGRDSEVLQHERDLSSDHHITCAAALEGEEGEPAIIPAGGVVFFNCNVPHCTKVSST